MTAALSPLTVPIRIPWPLPEAAPASAVDELTAWLRSHGVHPLAEDFNGRRGLEVGATTLTYWQPLSVADYMAQLPPRAVRVPLLSHPSVRMLTDLARAGCLTCTSIHARTRPDPPDPLEGLLDGRLAALRQCTVVVDDRGCHPGPHIDHRWVGATWENAEEGTAQITRAGIDAVLRQLARDVNPGRPAEPAVVFRYDPPDDMPPALRGPALLIAWDPARVPKVGDVVTVWELVDGVFRQVPGGSRVVAG